MQGCESDEGKVELGLKVKNNEGENVYLINKVSRQNCIDAWVIDRKVETSVYQTRCGIQAGMGSIAVKPPQSCPQRQTLAHRWGEKGRTPTAQEPSQ